jgi:uncharacterized membrane protein YfcA
MAALSPRNTRGRYWLALALIGVVGGILSGLFAIGGGILMVPLLVWRAHLDQRQASATSLVAIIPVAVVSSAAYLVHGEVDVPAAALIAVGAAGGAVIGSALLRRISVHALRWMFIVFILVIAVRLLFVAPQRGHDLALSPSVAFGYFAVGLVMGIASGLFGIGGGIIAVPLLISFFAVSDLVAKGTSLLVTIPTSVIGTAANQRAGLVDVRGGLVVGVAAAAAAVPAVGLALLISARLSGLLFAALLIVVAAELGVKASRTARTNAVATDLSGRAVSGSSSPAPPPKASR